MSNPSIEDVLKTLSAHQATVLYWKCWGSEHEEIAKRMDYSNHWVQAQMSAIYKKLFDIEELDFNIDTHWSKRVEIIRKQVCPVLSELIQNNREILKEFPLVEPAIPPVSIEESTEEVTEDLQPEPQPEAEPEPDPEIMALVLYDQMREKDEKQEQIQKVPPPTIFVPPPRPPGPNWRRILILASLGLIGCLAVGVFGYVLGQGDPPVIPLLASETPKETSTVAPTETPAATFTSTLTPVPTDTQTPTITSTPTATDTPVPTETKSPIGLGIGDELRDDRVALKLIDVRYNEGYDRVGSRVAPVSFFFEYTNHSGQTLVVQFNKSNFVIEDNTGRTAECWFFLSPFTAFDAWNSNLNDNATVLITARCGLGRLPEDVTTHELTIHPFTSLPESTWIVEVPR